MKIKALSVALAAVGLVAMGASAQTPPPQTPSPEMRADRAAMRQACASDMATLCQGQTGRDAMMCMRQNHDKLSAPCQDAMAKMRAARRMRSGADSAGAAPPDAAAPPAN